MDQKTWNSMTSAQKDAARDLSGLTPQLIGLEGWRVEVITEMTGETRRFIVGRSTGWRPCHIELHNRRSRGGISAQSSYGAVRKVEKVR